MAGARAGRQGLGLGLGPRLGPRVGQGLRLGLGGDFAYSCGFCQAIISTQDGMNKHRLKCNDALTVLAVAQTISTTYVCKRPFKSNSAFLKHWLKFFSR